MGKCIFDKAWIGPCNKECEGAMCDEHSKEKCCSCGAPATKQCDHTGGLVCGYPLCDDCCHAPPAMDEKLFLGMNFSHAKREVAEAAWEKHWKDFEAAMRAAREPQ